MRYTTLSLVDITSALEQVAQDAQTTFGKLDARQLNWKPDATRWSVGQCFDHLVTANALMFRNANDALQGTASPTVWQRMPVLPRLYGWTMVRSLEPTTTRKFTAPARARPAASDMATDIISRFVEQHRDAVEWVRTVDERHATRAIMTSPFARQIVYSVLDAFRIVAAHDRRHFEQARRVTLLAEFPR